MVAEQTPQQAIDMLRLIGFTVIEPKPISIVYLRTTDTSCEWELNDPDYGTWRSDCENEFTVIEGSPTHNGMRFCCHCGRPLKEVTHAAE